MKAIIYAGIGLFSAATVYGVADYFISEKKGTLKELYADNETSAAEEKQPIINNGPEKTTTVALLNKTETKVAKKTAKKTKKAKRIIRLDDFSRGRIPEIVPDEVIADEIKIMPVATEPVPAKAEVKTVIAEKPAEIKTTAIKPAKPERKISLDMFSRAPLKSKRISKETKQ